jgi:anti-sigma-K factor RskA
MSKNSHDLDFKTKILEKLMELSKLMFEYENKKNESAERINKDNNNFWGKLMIGVGVVAVGAVGAAATVLMNNKDK